MKKTQLFNLWKWGTVLQKINFARGIMKEREKGREGERGGDRQEREQPL